MNDGEVVSQNSNTSLVKPIKTPLVMVDFLIHAEHDAYNIYWTVSPVELNANIIIRTFLL